MADYLVTAFKVVVGVITRERLAIAGIVALCLLALFIIFSLVFSFQYKFYKNAKKINEFVSRNGLAEESRKDLETLVGAMPSEFQRGYRNWRDGSGKPSKYIRRFESLDVELSGGVFNQNKSIMKTFINFVFLSMLVLSLAMLPIDAPVTGYDLAEAAFIPLMFLLGAKIFYYVYTAIRQYQYKSAVDEFNDLVDNLDQAYKATSAEASVSLDTKASKAELSNINVDTNAITESLRAFLDNYLKDYALKSNSEVTAANFYDAALASSAAEEVEVNESKEAVVKEPKVASVEAEDKKEVASKEQENEQEKAAKSEEKKQEPKVKAEQKKEEGPAKAVKPAVVVEKAAQAEPKKEAHKAEASLKEREEAVSAKPAKATKQDFAALLDKKEEEQPAAKRGRGRPKKEVNQSGQFVIKNDQDFEEALLRAEKLMRKNEEPLSVSQTKRIEKQIKELVDAMTKYKENK